MQKVGIMKPLLWSTVATFNYLCQLLVLNLLNGTFVHFTWFIDKLSNVSVNMLLISKMFLIQFRGGEGVK